MLSSINSINQPIKYTDSYLPQNNLKGKGKKLGILDSLELKNLNLFSSPLLLKKGILSTLSNQSVINKDIETITYENICEILGFNPSIINPKSLDDMKYPIIKNFLNKNINTRELKTILEMIKLLPNNSEKDDFYKDISEIYLRNEDVSNALHVIGFIKDKYIFVRLLDSSFSLVKSQNEFRKALYLTNSIDHEATRAITLRNLSQQAFDSQSLSMCLYVIDCIPEDESNIKKSALLTLIEKFLDLKEYEKNNSVKEEYDRLIQQISSKYSKEFVNFELR